MDETVRRNFRDWPIRVSWPSFFVHMRETYAETKSRRLCFASLKKKKKNIYICGKSPVTVLYVFVSLFDKKDKIFFFIRVIIAVFPHQIFN